MTGGEILERLKAERRGLHKFIKWWRIENDFVDYELIDTFIDGVETDQVFAGYELLDMEQMWSLVQQHAPDRVTRERQGDNELVHWEHHTKQGQVKDEVCPFIASSLMTILNVETRGNVID